MSSAKETVYHVAYAFYNWSRAIEVAIQTDFFVLVMTAALLFEELGERLQNPSITSVELERWKRHYHQVSCFLEGINSIFGLILLTQISYIIIEMTWGSYKFMLIFKKGQFKYLTDDEPWYHFVIRFTDVLFGLLIIAVGSWHMQNQVYASFLPIAYLLNLINKPWMMVGNVIECIGARIDWRHSDCSLTFRP